MSSDDLSYDSELEPALGELIESDPLFAIEYSVQPRAALSRVRALTADERCRAASQVRGMIPDRKTHRQPINTTAIARSGVNSIGPESILSFGDSESPLRPALKIANPTATLIIRENVLGQETVVAQRRVSLSEVFDKQHHPVVPAYDFGPAALKTDGLTLVRPWLGPLSPMSVEFDTSQIPSAWPAEAQLFARDPEDLGRFADQLETDFERIRDQVRTITTEGGTAGLQWPFNPPTSPSNPPMSQARVSTSPRAITLPDALSIVSPATEVRTIEVNGKAMPFVT